MRECGECSACCTFLGIPELDKPPEVVCTHDCGAAGCAIFGRPERPSACSGFRCAWLVGVGAEEDRPDANGLIGSIADFSGRDFSFAIETRPGALYGSGRAMVKAFAASVPLPIVVKSFESKFPNDRGDHVVVRSDLLPRTKKMRGPFVGIAGPGLKVYKLKNAATA